MEDDHSVRPAGRTPVAAAGSIKWLAMGSPQTDEIVGELYLVPPARFIATRDELVRKAREAGHRQLAQALQGLRRPTQSAWLVNLLTRHEREAMDSLSALGRQLREAQVRLDGAQLRLLSAQRKPLIYELLERARTLATEAGMAPTDKVLSEVEATLQAALVDLAASSTVMSGRLVRPMSHSGFGPMPALDHPPVASVMASAADRGPDGQPSDAPASTVDPPPVAPPTVAPPRVPLLPEQAAESEQWVFWPVESPGEAVSPSDAPSVSDDRRGPRSLEEARARRRQAPTSPRRPVVDGTDSVRRAEAALAAAESRHWQREHELADAQAALEAAIDRLQWLEQQRLEAKAAKATAERHAAEARAAQRSAVRAVAEARRGLQDALQDAETRLHQPPNEPATD